jgi:hypothetical protein
LTKQLPGLFGRRVDHSIKECTEDPEPVTLRREHYRHGSMDPLLNNGEHSPEPSSNTPDDSSGQIHALDLGHLNAHPLHLTALPSLFSTAPPNLSLSDPRRRHASVDSFQQSITTMVDINVVPPSREASRGPSPNQSQLDLTDIILPPHVGDLANRISRM